VKLIAPELRPRGAASAVSPRQYLGPLYLIQLEVANQIYTSVWDWSAVTATDSFWELAPLRCL